MADVAPPTGTRTIPAIVVGGVVAILVIGGLMVRRAEARTNKVALASKPQAVGVVMSKASTYRASRAYGGTFRSWNVAGVGPQTVSAYVQTVLVRPGAHVKKGEVIAALDCREASATSKTVAMRADALATRQQAVANEAGRLAKLDSDAGAFISKNDLERAVANTAEELANVEAEKAALARMAVAVDDCIVRAPFDGEVAERFMDPGFFARPGSAIVSVIDRSVVRFVADAPETDYDVVAPGTKVRIRVYATDAMYAGMIARRAPGTAEGTRTVQFEVDVPDPSHAVPANTTGEALIQVGEPVPATEVPLAAASVKDRQAALFVVEGGVARRRSAAVKGEIGGSIYLDTSLPAGLPVVATGRALLEDGDRVDAVALASPADADADGDAGAPKGVAP